GRPTFPRRLATENRKGALIHSTGCDPQYYGRNLHDIGRFSALSRKATRRGHVKFSNQGTNSAKRSTFVHPTRSKLNSISFANPCTRPCSIWERPCATDSSRPIRSPVRLEGGFSDRAAVWSRRPLTAKSPEIITNAKRV